LIAIDKHTLAMEEVASGQTALEIAVDETHVYFIAGNSGVVWAAPRAHAPGSSG